MNNDTLILGGREFHSRFILGSGKYSLKLIEAAVKDAGAELITLAVRRANTKEEENILDYIPETTKIIIAQRISSVQDADRIIVMDGGTIADIGTHEELLLKSPIYQEVYTSQNKGGDPDEK